MLKILPAKLQQYLKLNFQMFKLDLEKAEEPEIKLPTSTGSLKKQESSRKTSISALLIVPKPLTLWITTNYGKFLNDGSTRPPYLPPEKPLCRSWSCSLEPDLEQTGSKSGKEYVKAVYCHLAYLNYAKYIMWNARLDEAQAGIKIAGRTSITSDMQVTPRSWQKVKRN